MKIMWSALSNDTRHGYGHVGVELFKVFERLGVDFVPLDHFGWDCQVTVGLPMSWVVGTSLRPDLVYHTMFEFEPVPSGWIDVLNRVGLVWFPSKASQALFVKYGLKTPSFVAGYGVDTDIFYFEDRSKRDSERLKFLVWGHKLTGRKNVLRTINAFISANLPDVDLEVKLRDRMSASYVKSSDGTIYSNITIYAQDWSRYQLASWLRSGDVLIYLSGGEGFGLQPLEAMATGLPVICTDTGGMKEYLSDDVAYLVPTTGRRIGDPTYDSRFSGTYTCEEPDYDAAVQWMRHIRYNIDEARVKGLSASQMVSTTWTWDHQGLLALNQLRNFY